MSKEVFCELLPPGVSTVNNLPKTPNKREVFPQPSMSLKENSPIPEERKFSQETREKLIDRGFNIYQLKGISLRDLEQSILQTKACHFSLYPIRECPFTSNNSRKSEVAFKPKNWVLPQTIDKDFYTGLSYMRNIAERIKNNLEIKDIEIIVGEAVDYIDLIIQHFDKTEEYLLIQNKGEKSFESHRIDTTTFVGKFEYYSGGGFGYREVEEYAYISTHFNPSKTPKDNERYLQVQKSNNFVIDIDHHCRCHPAMNTGIAPLIVPL